MRIGAIVCGWLLLSLRVACAQGDSTIAIREAMDEYELQLGSARAIGRMEEVVQIDPDSEPQLVADAAVKIVFSRPKFYVDLSYRTLLVAKPLIAPPQQPNRERRWTASTVGVLSASVQFAF